MLIRTLVNEFSLVVVPSNHYSYDADPSNARFPCYAEGCPTLTRVAPK